MSMDASLRSGSGLTRHRNVLKRGERLLRLAELDKWNPEKPVLGLVKVGNRKMAIAKAEKKTDDAAADPKAAGAKAAAPAAGAKAPAAGAKAAAPAAKAPAKK